MTSWCHTSHKMSTSDTGGVGCWNNLPRKIPNHIRRQIDRYKFHDQYSFLCTLEFDIRSQRTQARKHIDQLHILLVHCSREDIELEVNEREGILIWHSFPVYPGLSG